MDKIEQQFSKLEFIEDFRKRIKNRSYESTVTVAIETANILREIIIGRKDSCTTLDELLKLIKVVGKMFIAVDVMQFTVGNIVKRILNFIHKEKSNTIFLTSSTNIISPIIEQQENEENKETQQNNKFNYFKRNTTYFSSSFKGLSQENFNPLQPPVSTRNKISPSNVMDKARDTIITEINELINTLEETSDNIIEHATDHINNNDTILTANLSEQLLQYLSEAAKSCNFNVLVTESYPSLKGIEMAKKLNKVGIKSIIISDSSIFSIMPRVSKVMIGTRAIMANGGLISYNGVYNICLAANCYNVPVVVLSGSFKLTPMYPFDHETFNEQLSPDTIYNSNYKGDISNITFNSPAYDYVPPELISLFVTDKGDFHPTYIYRLFNEFYAQQDFYL